MRTRGECGVGVGVDPPQIKCSYDPPPPPFPFPSRRVLALEAENAAIRVAGTTAEAALSAAEHLVDGAADLLAWPLVHMDKIFDIHDLAISAGSLGGLSKGVQADMTLDATLAGLHIDWKLKFTFPPTADSLLGAIWAEVRSHFKL